MTRSRPETDGAGVRAGVAGSLGQHGVSQNGASQRRGGGAGRILALALVRLFVVAGLAVDGYVHVDLAGLYSEAGGAISEGVLFRAEAVVALAVAILVAATGRRMSYVAALVVAASALAAMLVARYVDVGAIGPFPDLYDPVWFPEKVLAAIGEGVAVLAAAAGIALLWTRKARAEGQTG
ncbi:MAG TPA: hypothetical protein VF162_20450 [Streptosporangiaceae bacterium]